MRLLHVHSGNLYGGVETLLVTLVREGMQYPVLKSEFALCFEGRLAAELREAGAAVHRLGGVRRSNPVTRYRALWRLVGLWREFSFDAVICHNTWALSIFGKSAKDAGMPLVFWMHDAATGTHPVERAAQRVIPDMALCNSHYTAATLPRLFPTASATVIHLPVSLDRMSVPTATRETLRAKLATPANSVVIAQVSRMEAWKGHELHLDALARLQDVPGWVCWMIGGAQRGTEQRYLEGLVERTRRLGLAERVHFLGQRADVPALLHAADIFCQPNRDPEPFGIVFVEALAAGLPVVTTTIGAAPEIIDPSCGIAVVPGDADALAHALRTLIQDRDARMRLGTNGPVRAAVLCDPRTQLERLHAAIARVIDK
jgi:glycosyltransferase involved in cell wall biosynthesis